jgi:hypothetical protein
MTIALAALCVVLTGCADPSGMPGATPSASGSGGIATDMPSEAAGELIAAAQKLNDDTVKVTEDAGGTRMVSTLDPKAGKATIVWTMPMDRGRSTTVEARILGQDVYWREDPTVDSGKWVHFDRAALAGTPFEALTAGDPVGAGRYVGAVIDVKSDGHDRYSGTLDFAKVRDAGGSVDEPDSEDFPVPFTATIDNQRRLINLSLQLSSIDSDLSIEITYTDFGAPLTVEAPPAIQVEEAKEMPTIPGPR